MLAVSGIARRRLPYERARPAAVEASCSRFKASRGDGCGMSVVLAALAGIAAAAGLTELAAARRPRARRPTPLHLVARIGSSLGVKPSGGLAARVAAAGIDRPTNEIVALQA